LRIRLDDDDDDDDDDDSCEMHTAITFTKMPQDFALLRNSHSRFFLPGSRQITGIKPTVYTTVTA